MAVAAYERTKKRNLPWPWIVGIMAVALLLSCFLTWRGLYHQTQELTRAKTTLQGDRKALQAKVEAQQGEIGRLSNELSRRPLPTRELRFVQEAVSSDDKDAPYAVRVVIQTNVTSQPTSLNTFAVNHEKPPGIQSAAVERGSGE